MARPLFVYGSLRRGGENHDQLSGAQFLRPARTVARYALAEVGEYLGLIAGDQALTGELYEVDEALLAALDEFEGPEYERVTIELEPAAASALAGAAAVPAPRRAVPPCLALAYAVRTR